MKRYEICIARLDPVQGSEMGKTRPVVIVSDDLRNQLLQTVVGCPLTSQLHPAWKPQYVFHRDAGNDMEVNLDGSQLRHVLMELLENSQGFKKTNAVIEIRTGRAGSELTTPHGLKGDCAFVDYGDNGPGIPDDKKQSVFEPFVSFRQGSGLGLSIVRQVVEAHGGKIVECGRYGNGARFLLFLPITPEGD